MERGILYMTKITRNILISPIVFFVRFPLLLPFFILIKIGEFAEKFSEFVSDRIPGFNR